MEASNDDSRPVKLPKLRHIDIHPNAQLTPLQRQLIIKFAQSIDLCKESIVITNPLVEGNPIVFVTESWQSMCGFTYAEAVGKNPKLTQGSQSDPEVIKLISGALSRRCSCKVQLLNYRSGSPSNPFWNMLSISPLLYRGEMMLYIASLQDYSHHVSKLSFIKPTQFCRVAEHQQRGRRISETLPALTLAKPAIYEGDDDYPLSREGNGGAPSNPSIKRLGWSKLVLEPEHLHDRVVDALANLNICYEMQRRSSPHNETFMVDAKADGVALRVVVHEDPDGTYRISCTRLNGDTFVYHNLFRQLKNHIVDAVQEGCPTPVGFSNTTGRTRSLGLGDFPSAAGLQLRQAVSEKLLPATEMNAGCASPAESSTVMHVQSPKLPLQLADSPNLPQQVELDEAGADAESNRAHDP